MIIRFTDINDKQISFMVHETELLINYDHGTLTIYNRTNISYAAYLTKGNIEIEGI